MSIRINKTCPCTIWRMSALFIVVSHLVEVILVELANKTRKIAVLEMLREDGFCESFILE